MLLWDAKKHGQIAAIVLPELGRSCHFSPDNKFIAVGLVNGAFCIYAYHQATSFRNATLQLIKCVHDCVETIDDLKYSPNGNFLAVASHDNYIDIYDCRDSYNRLSRCKGHTSYVTCIDWSKTAKYCRAIVAHMKLYIGTCQVVNRYEVRWTRLRPILTGIHGRAFWDSL